GDGVYWFDPKGHFTRLEGLSQGYILSLAMDREGSLWVGMNGGGVNRAEPQTFHSLEGSPVMTVQSVCADAKGGLWLGIIEGVRYWQNGEIKQMYLGKASVRAVLVDRQQRVWAGTGSEGLYQLQNRTFIPAPGAELL